MSKEINCYIELAKLFKKNGFDLFLVGGSVRDYLLNKPLKDLDCATNATPNDIKKFLQGDFSFEKFGNSRIKFLQQSFEITTFRKEKEYSDFRHPKVIILIKNMKKDSLRRDFTINGMYIDINLKIYDYSTGRKDINNKTIKTICNPNKRIKEDPLRILRAIRFALMLDFSIDSKLERAIYKYKDLLMKLSKEKIVCELKKIKGVNKNQIEDIFKKYSIQYLLDMIDLK